MRQRSLCCLLLHATVFTLLVLLTLPAQQVHADIGPKPSMDFRFVQEADPPLSVIEATLLECDDAACAESHPLESIGAQYFSCTQAHCLSMAYRYTNHHRLVVRFSDGTTRQSNVFDKGAFHATYRVVIREDDLAVKEDSWSSSYLNMAFFAGTVGACITGILILMLVVILALLILRAGKGRGSFDESRGLFIASWPLSAIGLVLGSLSSLSLAATVAIEVIIATIYATLRRRSKPALLTVVILVNVITQPALRLAQVVSDGIVLLIIAELIVWIVESAILYLTQQETVSVRETLGLGLLLNATSFLVGLFLPI